MASTLRSSAARRIFAATKPTSAIRLLPQTRVAAFHASQQHQILPPGPHQDEGILLTLYVSSFSATIEVVHGTVNDPVPVPIANATHGSYHWAFERIIALGMIPLTVAPFAAGTANPALDAALGTALVLHSHIGFDACVTDYFPKRQYAKTRTFMVWLLRASTITAAVGLFSIQTNDVGLTEGIKRFWRA
ncbi:membrane anchor subunit of succinate dehydrogenase, Sdh4 [Orbilia oligospora]|uniref:Succinate dehydrogenase [ubiquinone] cytochrome b small subunit n=1 Tax=Orbilia oligospora TaxID=2813651 RepID=A0A7C8U9P3_ORBOL|nr:membrane anchor subunit of succinate dehydrogenase, Sdh4 [Orbilia oligospora]